MSRLRDDIKSDGSRIESCHKHWNSLQRSFSCGLENFVALGHNHVLRTNIRVGYSKTDQRAARPFLASTFGSHHIDLVNNVAKTWNKLLALDRGKGKGEIAPQPVLQVIETTEKFGLVSSAHIASFGGLLTIKDDAEIEDALLDMPLNEAVTNEDVISTLGIDPASLSIPEQKHSSPASHTSSVNFPSSSTRIDAASTGELGVSPMTTTSTATALSRSDWVSGLDQTIVSIIHTDTDGYWLDLLMFLSGFDCR